MITSNGTSKIGNWLLKPNTTYEPNDIIIGLNDYSENPIMAYAPVKRRFTSLYSVILSDYDEFLDKYDPSENYATKDQVSQIVAKSLRFFTVSGNRQVIAGDLMNMRIPGLYLGTETTSGLPSAYGSTYDFSPNDCLIRISTNEQGSRIYWELLDFLNLAYFIRSANSNGTSLSEWTDLAGDSVKEVSKKLNDTVNEVGTIQSRTETLLNEYSNRLQYIKEVELTPQVTNGANILSGLFTASDGIKGYLINLCVTEVLDGYTEKSYLRKYSIRVEDSDAYGSNGFVYDEFGTKRTDKGILTLGKGVSITSIYRII